MKSSVVSRNLSTYKDNVQYLFFNKMGEYEYAELKVYSCQGADLHQTFTIFVVKNKQILDNWIPKASLKLNKPPLTCSSFFYLFERKYLNGSLSPKLGVFIKVTHMKQESGCQFSMKGTCFMFDGLNLTASLDWDDLT